MRRGDGDCAISIAAVLGKVFATAKRWRDELADTMWQGMSFYDAILVRHLALMGETLQHVQEAAPAGPQIADELVRVEVPVSAANALDLLARASSSATEGVLDDFGNRSDLPTTRTDPLLGSAYSTGWGSSEKPKVLVPRRNLWVVSDRFGGEIPGS